MFYLISTSSVPQIGVTHWSSVISKCQQNPKNIMFVVHLMVSLLDCFLCFVTPSSLLFRLGCPTIELFPVSSLAPTFSFLYLKFLPILIRTLNHRSSLGQRSSRRRTSTILLGLQGTLRDDLNDVVYREVHNFVLDSLSIMKVFVVSQTQETSIQIFNGLNLLDARKVVNSTPRQSQDACLELPFPSLRSLPFPTPKVCTSGRAGGRKLMSQPIHIERFPISKANGNLAALTSCEKICRQGYSRKLLINLPLINLVFFLH